MNTLAIFGNLAGPDMLIIFLIVLIMFGAKKLPELAKGLGQAVKEFSKAKEDVNHEIARASQIPDYSHSTASYDASHDASQSTPLPSNGSANGSDSTAAASGTTSASPTATAPAKESATA
jgi:sec-independent protein translocase protein TatA